MVIYKTTNIVNGRFYIGQDAHNDPNYLGSGLLLKQAIKKYGINNFKKEILEHCLTKKELNEKEIFWINKLNAQERNKGYNITKGGNGGDTFSNHPDKERIRENYRKSSTIFNNRPEIKSKIKKSMEERWKDEKYRNKVIKALKEAQSKKEYGEKLSKSLKKVIHTDEWNKKVGKNNIIRFHIKKIKYFIEQGIEINILSNYFNTSEEKILETINKHIGFDKEPNIDILLNAYNMHKNGMSLNKIRSKIENSPSELQIKIFIELINLPF